MSTRLDSYVDELRQELRDLPVTQRAEQLSEVRTHLNTLKMANQELGLTEEEAEAAAVAQMGNPQRTTRVERHSVWKTWCQGPFFAAHVFLTMGCLMFMVGAIGSHKLSQLQVMTRVSFALPLITLGWLVGAIVGKRQALLAIPLAVLPPLVVMYSFQLLAAPSMQGSELLKWLWPFGVVGVSAVPVLLGVLLSFRLPSRRRKLA